MAVGLLGDPPARRVLDATRLYVAAGFIDIHSHADDGNREPGENTIRTDSLHRKAATSGGSWGPRESGDFRRPATDGEMARMRTLVRQALDEGAVGLSAGLEYAPGRWSTSYEVAALAEELLPRDGVYISHERR